MAAETEPRLVVVEEGPLHVEGAAPVELSHVRLDNGAVPHGLQCSVEPEQVARFVNGRVVATSSGSAEVTCSWEEQRVTFPLDVQLATMLAFEQVPDQLTVGEQRVLRVHAHQGEKRVRLGPSRWETSNPSVLEVVPGQVVGRSPGVAFVTVRARGAIAQVQINVAP